MRKCWNCHSTLSKNARFCSHCGSPQNLGTEATAVTQEIKQELQQFFLTQFKQRGTGMVGRKKMKPILAKLESGGYLSNITPQLSTIFIQSKLLDPQDATLFLEEKLDRLIFSFLITEGQEHLSFYLPEKILPFFGEQPVPQNLQRLFFDCMDFHNEDSIIVYSKTASIPSDVLKNAQKSFLKLEEREELYGLVDISVFGKGKEGFALTNRAFYWKDLLSKSKVVDLDQIEQVNKAEDWLMINGHYFNVKRSINCKLLLFLKLVQWSKK